MRVFFSNFCASSLHFTAMNDNNFRNGKFNMTQITTFVIKYDINPSNLLSRRKVKLKPNQNQLSLKITYSPINVEINSNEALEIPNKTLLVRN